MEIIIKSLLNLEDSDFDLVLEGLDALKSKDLAGEMMGDMFEVMLLKEPKVGEPDYEENRKKWEDRQLEKEVEKAKKKQKGKELMEKVELAKAKIIIFREMKRREDFIKTSKKIKA